MKNPIHRAIMETLKGKKELDASTLILHPAFHFHSNPQTLAHSSLTRLCQLGLVKRTRKGFYAINEGVEA